MQRFIKKALFVIVVVFAVFMLLRFYTMQYRAKNYLSAFVDKLQILEKNKNNRKIVLIGGSSVGFGISAEMIEKQTGIKTINIGQNANFGLVDFQDFVLKNLTKDDIIIFSPEWKFYEDPVYSDQGTMDNLIDNNIGYGLLLHKPLYVLKAIFSQVSMYEFNSKSMKQRMALNKSPYVYNCFNANGDIISHCNLKPKGPQAEPLNIHNFDVNKFIKTFPFIFKFKTVIVFAPTPAKMYNRYKADLESVQRKLLSKNVKLLDNISNNVYPDSGFYDESNHLTCDYRLVRTKQIIDFLVLN